MIIHSLKSILKVNKPITKLFTTTRSMSNIPNPSTFHYQSQLPRLPIPKLDQTLRRWLKSVELFCTPDQLQEANTLVEDFGKPGGLGEKLQTRLTHYDQSQPNSWLEHWWRTYAYLVYRDPVCINITWGCVGKDHPSAPPRPPSSFRGLTPYQIARASHIIHHAAQAHERILQGTIPVEFFPNGSPQCMDQYRHLFGITRIPDFGEDRIYDQFPNTSTHIVILARGLIFQLEVYKLEADGSRTVNSVDDIAFQLEQLANPTEVKQHAPFTHMTGCHRDTWAEFRNNLIKHNLQNLMNLQTIERALFVVALDDHAIDNNLVGKYRANFHGDGSNRWYDKSLMFNVDAAGTVGMNGEHTPLDGVVPAQMFDHCLDQPFHWDVSQPNEFFTNELQQQESSWQIKSLNRDIHAPRQLYFDIPEESATLLAEGREQIDTLIANSDSRIVVFSNYGSEFIKKQAKLPVDGYLQMAQQLNYYTQFGHIASVYETASTRKFLTGRTEAIRACTHEGRDFIQFAHELFQRDDDNITSEDWQRAYSLLETACDTHRTVSRDAAAGGGIDRHMLGLRLSLREGESHPLFTHHAFVASANWDLSTSALFTSKHIAGIGFGAVTPQGVGVNYFHRPNEITFTVECKRDNHKLASGSQHWQAGLERCLHFFAKIAINGRVETAQVSQTT